MISLVLCDDNPRHNQTLRIHLQQILPKLPVQVEIVLATTDPDDVIAYAQATHNETVFFLDLELEQAQNGLDVCRAVRAFDEQAIIIYVSAYSEYAMECLETHAFDFVRKPYSMERLENALRDAVRFLTFAHDEVTLLVTVGSVSRLIDQKAIRYISVKREYVTAYLAEGQITWRESLTKLIERLNREWFVQIHKSCVMNRLYFESVNTRTHEITLTDGTILPVSRRCLSLQLMMPQGIGDKG